MKRNRLIYFLALLFLSTLICGQEPPEKDKQAQELVREVDENLMPESFEAYRKLINEEPDGSKKEFIFYTVKKGKEKVAMLYLSPASEKGRSALRS